ncbi:unnamed protein product [Polarella glacialis]|uniref:Methyltransferase n=1 Tax=Polarella glacialis TaxID=89957 RepID=A0A813I4C8_POLGL|nr:unnamed protein product [Polarella glacialis]
MASAAALSSRPLGRSLSSGFRFGRGFAAPTKSQTLPGTLPLGSSLFQGRRPFMSGPAERNAVLIVAAEQVPMSASGSSGYTALAEELIRSHFHKNDMMAESEIRGVLLHLASVLEAGIEGDIVELGCNVGHTSIFIQRFLDQCEKVLGSKGRQFHAYDSFHGLPKKHSKDGDSDWFLEGALAVPQRQFLRKFERAGVRLPTLHAGWFADASYPEKIAFAFFDGDFYDSILESFRQVYPRLAKPGARVVIDDYGSSRLPGCKLACDEFLADKPEKVVSIPMYGHERRHLEGRALAGFSTGGVLIKLAD